MMDDKVEQVAELLHDEFTTNMAADWNDVRDGETGARFREVAEAVVEACRVTVDADLAEAVSRAHANAFYGGKPMDDRKWNAFRSPSSVEAMEKALGVVL